MTKCTKDNVTLFVCPMSTDKTCSKCRHKRPHKQTRSCGLRRCKVLVDAMCCVPVDEQ